MFWRLEPPEYEKNFRERSLENVTGGPNKKLLKDAIDRGEIPGLLAYRDGRAVGWVSVSPRSQLIRLEHSRALRSDDGTPDERTWSIACLYVHRSQARTGVGTALVEAAIARAADMGASAIEAYPVKVGNVDPYTGYDVMFERAGFSPVKPGKGLGRSLWRRRP